MKLHIGDEVLVTAGKDKGRRGKIDKVFPKADKVRVEATNIYKKFRKPYAGQQGGVLEVARPLPVANVAFVCPKCKKATRIGFEVDKKGGKTRICLKCKGAITSKK